MKFRVDSAMFEKFSGLTLGVVFGSGIDNTTPSEELQTALREQEERLRAAYDLDALSAHPKIAVWREAYRAFGAKPNEHRSSVEALHRMVLSGKVLRPINSLVDLYNLVSLRHMLPVGGEDLDTIEGDLVLAFAGDHEPAVKLLGDPDPRPPHAGEVIYKDDISAICRRWNWREADRTKLTPETKNAVLAIEGLPPVTAEEVAAAVEELRNLTEHYCGGKLTTAMLNADHQELELISL